jgi:hypothetical protein
MQVDLYFLILLQLVFFGVGYMCGNYKSMIKELDDKEVSYLSSILDELIKILEKNNATKAKEYLVKMRDTLKRDWK